MSTLTLVFLGQLASSCPAAPVVPFDRVKATVEVESSYQALAVHENWPPHSRGRSYLPASQAEAVALVAALHAQGHSVDAGLMGLNDGNWSRRGLTAETVFDPRANVCAGMAVLADDYSIERRVSCRYNTGRPDCANGYPERIERATARLGQGGTPVAPAASLPPAAPPGRLFPPPCAPSWDAWALAACQARPHPPASSPPGVGASPPGTPGSPETVSHAENQAR